jgi:preprotein translocase subunit SecD
MTKNLHWRALAIVVVLALSVWAFYPLNEKVKLGLDLKGGVHLVLLVHTDDALKLETDLTIERLRIELDSANVKYTRLEPIDATSFRVDGIEDHAVFREKAVAGAETVFARSSTDTGYTFSMRSNIANQLRQDAVTQALETIERRVNELGVAEPVVARYGAEYQILVQLPGVTDVQRAKDIISSTALLEFRLVESGSYSTREAALESVGNNLAGDQEILPGRVEGGSGDVTASGFYIVKKTAVVAGNDLRSASASLDQYNRPAVDFTLKQDAAVRFGKFTGDNVGRPLGIVLDKRVMSSPTLRDRITDRGQITGITQEEMADLIITLKSGALPASLTYLESRTVGPSLGQDSIRAGVTAAVGGLGLVMLFMLFYYKLAGFNALASILMNLVILLGMMAYLGATMTLPGFAGFILTIGIGVDSNVLIFERIKEELAAGKNVKLAVSAGFDRVWWTIVDTHVASLIAAMFLFQFGTGPIRGFATSLAIGLAANVFTAVFVSRTVFEFVLSRRRAATMSI